MSPLHHHFELGGWAETKITLRFWIVAVLAGLLGITLFLATPAEAGVSVAQPRRPRSPRPSPRVARTAPCAASPSTVLGLARTGIALARFFADAGARGDGLRRQAGRRPGRRARLPSAGGRSTLACGPDVDPAAAWAGAALVAFSPSITPGFPTTEPRLRAALDALAGRVAAGDPDAPALVSEPDLFLRLCPAPTIGVTGTKGKTTTSSLAAHLLAGDPAHPVVLGGNIGTPLVDRLDELTPDHRVVDELSELQLPSLSPGHDRRRLHERDRRPPRPARLAGGLPAGQAPAGRAGRSGRRPRAQPRRPGRRRPTPPWARRRRSATGSPGRSRAAWASWTAGSSPRASSACPLAGGGVAATGPGGRILPVGELPLPGRHNLANLLAAAGVGTPLRRRPGRDPAPGGDASAASSIAWSWSPRSTACASSTTPRARSPTRSPPPCGASTPPLVLIAGGRDKGVDLAALGPVAAERAAAAVLIGESGPALASLFRGAGVRARRGGRHARPRRCRGPTRIARELLAAAPDGYGRDRAALAGGRQLRPVRRLRGPRAAPSRTASRRLPRARTAPEEVTMGLRRPRPPVRPAPRGARPAGLGVRGAAVRPGDPRGASAPPAAVRSGGRAGRAAGRRDPAPRARTR